MPADPNCGVDSEWPFGVPYGMVPQVVIHDAGNRRWLEFVDPVEIVTTNSLEEVALALGRLEDRVEHGKLWAAGFLSYEAAPAFDKSLLTHADNSFPKLWFGIYTEPRTYDNFHSPEILSPLLNWEPAISRSRYRSAIKRIKELIAAGDTYQVNFTTRLRAGITAEFDTMGYFQALTRGQQATYAAFIDIGEFAICSASPELFFQQDGDRIVTRPMKGTVKRGNTSREDTRLSEWLFNSEKNRAENVMIVDMMRNDLGKIARIGSVKVPQLFCLERYPTVWQMTSEVTASTSSSLCDIIAALFPAASVTGAPKPRTMQIISGLESEPRRIYTGSIGFIAPNRHSQFSVAIRTVLIDRQLQVAEYGVGGGIVWDSSAAEEYDECLVKAQVLARRPPEFSLLETMLWAPVDRYYLLEHHLQRLSDSAGYFGFTCDLPQVRARLDELGNQLNGRQRVRLLVNRDGEITLQHDALVDTPPALPVRLRLAASPIDSRDTFLYHKTTNRIIYEAARREVSDCDDVVLFNEDGFITETSIDNIIVEKSDGTFVTPPVSAGLLAGTYRAFLLEQGKITEEAVTIDGLKSAASIAVVNSVRGWRPAVMVTQNPD